jgi:hypothetical protein
MQSAMSVWHNQHSRSLGAVFLLLLFLRIDIQAQEDYEAPEPYPPLHHVCHDCHPKIPESPDPLIAATWNFQTDEGSKRLQYYRVDRPIQYQVSPPDAIQGLDAWMKNQQESPPPIVVSQPSSLLLDWGVERAAWFELTSPNDNLHVTTTASLSEFNMPYPDKTRPLTKYGNHTYRLETNDQLYEGIRFTWLFFTQPVILSNVNLVAKVKPINYTGYFWSSSSLLTRAWYTGAYGVRLNMEQDQLNSILIERGDRVAIQGDGHPTIAAALVAFSSSYNLIQQVLNQTNSGDHHVVDQEIMAYPLYWCLSVMDYFMETGDLATFNHLARDIMKIVDARIQDFLSHDLDITWFGPDDRLGGGWCFHSKGDQCPKEAHLAFASLVARVCKDFARMLSLANLPVASQKYQQTYKDLGARLRAIPEWPHGLGVHAAANAINTGMANAYELDVWNTNVLNDAVTICSYTQFNQYWILQALGNARRMEHAIASIKLCWGTPLKLGKGCFWEVSSPEWLRFMRPGDVCPGLHSYCHPWASGVTAWLSHALGGIQPLLPGYQQVLAAPYVSPTHPDVHASISSPVGTIYVNATLTLQERTAQETVYTLRAKFKSPVPGYFGLWGRLIMPNGELGGHLKRVGINCKAVDFLKTIKEANRLGGNTKDLRFVPLTNGGTFQISATYHHYHNTSNNFNQTKQLLQQRQVTEEDEQDDVSPFPRRQYPASVVGIDEESHGNGLKSHGRDGYILLGCNEFGNDTVKLPTYIQNVSVLQHGYPGWFLPEREFIGISDDDETYLPVEDGTSQRKLGTYS